MKLAVVTYAPITTEGECRFVNESIGQLVDLLADDFSEIQLVGSSPPKDDMTYYPNGRSIYQFAIDTQKIHVVLTPWTDSRQSPLTKLVGLVKRGPVLLRVISAADFVYIMMPGFSGALACMLCWMKRKPYGLYFGANWIETAEFMARWAGINRALYHAYRLVAGWTERTVASRASFAVVHGDKTLARVREVQETTVAAVPLVNIKESDFYYRDDTHEGTEIVCAYAGPIIPRKGLDYLVRAVAGLHDQQITWVIHAAGRTDSGYEAELRRLASDLKVEELVRFIGHIESKKLLLEFYRSADLFVLPTLGEGFPRVIYEAMSQGLPVVTSRIESVVSQLDNERAAMLVPPRDVAAIRDALTRLARDRNLRMDLIRTGYDFARSRIGDGFEAAARQLTELVYAHSQLGPND